MGDRKKDLQVIADRLAVDSEFRDALTRESEALRDLLARSELSKYAIDSADASLLLTLLGEGREKDVPAIGELEPSAVGKHIDVDGGPLGGPSGGGCFAGETLVATEHGLRAIRDIRVGDLVESSAGLRAVTNLHSVERGGLTRVSAAGTTVDCSREHRFFERSKGWTSACSLDEGDVIRAPGAYLTVVARPRALDGTRRVFNLTVDEAHNYHVGEARLLVHNAKPGPD